MLYKNRMSTSETSGSIRFISPIVGQLTAIR